jgi:hypothetical protein
MSPEPILSSSQFHKRFKNTHQKHHPHAENREQTPNILNLCQEKRSNPYEANVTMKQTKSFPKKLLKLNIKLQH